MAWQNGGFLLKVKRIGYGIVVLVDESFVCVLIVEYTETANITLSGVHITKLFELDHGLGLWMTNLI